MISGRRRPAEYARREKRPPGKPAAVQLAPPTTGRRSRTRVERPAFARYPAATSPLCPPPTTIASNEATVSPLRRRRLPVVVVLVGGHGPAIVEPPGAVLGRDLPEGPGHLPDVHGDRAAARTDEVHAHRGRLLRVRGHLLPREGEGLELERELREGREVGPVVRRADRRRLGRDVHVDGLPHLRGGGTRAGRIPEA